MSSIPVLKPREVIATLAAPGFKETRQRGSHKRFRHEDGRVTTVPVHPCSTRQCPGSGSRRKGAFLFPKNAARRSPYNIVRCWHTVRAHAKLGSVRLHDLRHTAASHAVMSGENLRCITLAGIRRSPVVRVGFFHVAAGITVDVQLVVEYIEKTRGTSTG